MININFFLHKRETKYIRLSSRQCQVCRDCVAVCPEAVLVKMGRFNHMHVLIRNPKACSGCKKCVRTCEHAAIEYTYVPRASQELSTTLSGK
ncbi:MAG: 4Fe-4S dicluster domain-containing protein [Anaerolineales bacterium]